MPTNKLSWPMVHDAARDLGATEVARKKWKSRKVPWEWRVKIASSLAKSGITIDLSDFDKLESAPRRTAA